jgi:hypothetical protein
MPTEAMSPVSRSTSTLTSAVCSTSAFTSSKCPQNLSPTSGDLPRDDAHPPDTWIQAISCAASDSRRRHRPPLQGGALRCRARQQKTAHLRAVLLPKRASDGLEPSTPSLPSDFRCNRSQPTATVFACLRRFQIRVVCQWLPPVTTAWLHKCSIRLGASP